MLKTFSMYGAGSFNFPQSARLDCMSAAIKGAIGKNQRIPTFTADLCKISRFRLEIRVADASGLICSDR